MEIKKIVGLLSTLILLAPIATSCQQDNSYIYLKVLNSEDYIYKYDAKEAAKEGGNKNPDLTVQFENYINPIREKAGKKKVKVVYDTFDTMENMFNTLRTGKTKYDLICASEYMIQKLVKENLLIPLDKDQIPFYRDECSPFINKQLDSIVFKKSDTEPSVKLGDYCIDYMWGTLGIIYNPTYSGFKKEITPEKIFNDAKSYNILWNHDYNKTISIKDSMRDTYAVGVLHKYQDEFNALHKKYEAGEIELDDYKKQLSVIFNRGGEEDADAPKHINEVQNDLLELRNNIFGFEVDSGKEDICTGKIGIDIAWSGDAVYSIEKANDPEETQHPFDLYFSIPEEGSNLWFDCWCMQDNDHKDAAYEFLDFISDPNNAIQNMDYIGYTSPIADGDNGLIMSYFQEKYEPETEDTVLYDVTYFFDQTEKYEPGTLTIEIDRNKENRNMAAQFPKADIIDKLMVMKDYGKNNDLITKMWEQVKHERLPNWAIILFSIEGAAILVGVGFIIYFKVKNKNRKKYRLANK